MFFFTMGFNLILPEMNALLTDLGGASLKGLVIGLFTLSAGISRPFSGKLADYIGRKKVMAFGAIVSALICLFYPVGNTVIFLLILRFLHGFSAGFFPTGATALVTDVLPEKKRGAGMGIWGTFISLGIGVGNGLSSPIVTLINRDALFFFAAGISILAFYLMTRTSETLANPQRFNRKQLIIKPNEIIEPSVIPVAIVMFLSAICSGIIFVLSPDIAGYLGLTNKGWFFVFYVLSTISVRLFIGRLSDKIGRRETLLIGMVVLTISMYLIGIADTVFTFTLSSVLFGLATGISSPTIFAWTADLSPYDRRGIGAGTMFIALEFGILAGSSITTLIYTNTVASVWQVFSVGSIMAFGCVIYLSWHLWKRKPLILESSITYQRKKVRILIED